MNCEALRELLWAYLENETTAEEKMEIEKHLAGCAACREELEAQKAIMETLQSLPDEELPEGYHRELMQKLQAEAAPNVVPFPAKKKQPKWKQLSMIAAAVFVVVAAGGMKGMLDMRQNQHEIVQDMVTDAAVAEDGNGGMPQQKETAAESEKADAAADVQQKTETYNVKPKNTAPAAKKNKPVVIQETEPQQTLDAAAIPEVASAQEDDGDMNGYSMVRSAGGMMATDRGTLLADDITAAAEELREAIVNAKGTEEETTAEHIVCAVIPVENFEGFCQELATIGQMDWLEQADDAEGISQRRVEIQLKSNE